MGEVAERDTDCVLRILGEIQIVSSEQFQCTSSTVKTPTPVSGEQRHHVLGVQSLVSGEQGLKASVGVTVSVV